MFRNMMMMPGVKFSFFEAVKARQFHARPQSGRCACKFTNVRSFFLRQPPQPSSSKRAEFCRGVFCVCTKGSGSLCRTKSSYSITQGNLRCGQGKTDAEIAHDFKQLLQTLLHVEDHVRARENTLQAQVMVYFALVQFTSSCPNHQKMDFFFCRYMFLLLLPSSASCLIHSVSAD